MARIFMVLVAAAWLMAGCGGDDKEKGKWYDACSVNADCAKDLQCRSALCNIPCTSNGDCTKFATASTTVECQATSCYIICETNNSCPGVMSCCSLLGTSKRTCKDSCM